MWRPLGDQPQGSFGWDGAAGEWSATTELNLPLGQVTTYTYTYTVVQQDATAQSDDEASHLKNAATVSGAGLPQEPDPNDPTPPTDTDDRVVEDYGKVAMRPADITVYMGGDKGYEGVLGDDNEVTTSNSLPEPGFYFNLPDKINEELSAAMGVESTEAVDLSQFITMTAKDNDGVSHTWELKKYGNTSSTAWEGDSARFIYKLEPMEEGGAHVRVSFVNDEGDTVTSDNFDANTALSEEYKMQVYLGDAKIDSITFAINIPDKNDSDTTVRTYYCGYDVAGSQEATLTVRHTTEDAETTQAVTDLDATLQDEKMQEQFLVEVGDDQNFNINDAESADGVDVAVGAVHLLADEIEQLEGENNLVQTAQKKAGFASSGTDAQYLDLVDADNGNAWLTPDEGETVTVYWPYPAGTDKSTTFKLFHYEGMDRDAVNTAAADSLNPKEMTIVEKTDTGLTFKTDNFSPFVLVWDTTTSTGGGDNSSNDNNNSNTNNTNDQTTTVNVTNEAPAPAAPTAATVPQTSDDMPVGALTAAAAAAAAALGVLLVVRKRRHGKD